MPDANSVQVGGTHYKKKAVQHWDYAAQLPYLDGQVSKYIDRHQSKGGFQDLLKAEHYLHKMMEVYYPQEYAQHCNSAQKESKTPIISMREFVTLTLLYFAAASAVISGAFGIADLLRSGRDEAAATTVPAERMPH